MTTQRCIELFEDRELQAFLHEESEKRVRHDKELQADCWAAAWAWISSSAPDEMDRETIMEYAAKAIENEYRRELHERNLVSELLELCNQEDAELADFEPFGRRSDAGRLLK